MIISRQLTRLSLAGVLVGLSLAANARSQPEQASADIRRTSFGVPHIRADNERGLGYGIGYAYAQDNLCCLLYTSPSPRDRTRSRMPSSA